MGRPRKSFDRTSTCLNPNCTNEVVWEGRIPKLYCGPTCRKLAGRHIALLREQARAVDKALARRCTDTERTQLEQHREELAWNMLRYVGCVLTTAEVLERFAVLET